MARWSTCPAPRIAISSVAAVVNLGALGVITKVTLDVEPTYQVKQVVYRGPVNGPA